MHFYTSNIFPLIWKVLRIKIIFSFEILFKIILQRLTVTVENILNNLIFSLQFYRSINILSQLSCQFCTATESQHIYKMSSTKRTYDKSSSAYLAHFIDKTKRKH